MSFSANTVIGIVGAGTMGRGIAQIAAQYGHAVRLCDASSDALASAKEHLEKILRRLEEKKRLGPDSAATVLNRIVFTREIAALKDCGLVIEAVVEVLEVKKEVFRSLERVVSADCVLATNTSSQSVTSLSAVCRHSGRVLGTHFFNPAPLMPLVEVVPGMLTAEEVVQTTRQLLDDWGKTTVIAKDTPGFIVNRVARPFYGEALRLLEEGIADVPTIDWAMKTIGGFPMGPFELMDLIGNDINYAVNLSVFTAFFYDPRYKPSFTQMRMVEAGFLGRKTGRGYYDYRDGAVKPEPVRKRDLGELICNRIVTMLINEAVDALFWNVATRDDIDLAMVNGVNYPKGLLRWADEIGLDMVLRRLENTQEEYGEDRYRPSPLLRRMVRENRRFYE